MPIIVPYHSPYLANARLFSCPLGFELSFYRILRPSGLKATLPLSRFAVDTNDEDEPTEGAPDPDADPEDPADPTDCVGFEFGYNQQIVWIAEVFLQAFQTCFRHSVACLPEAALMPTDASKRSAATMPIPLPVTFAFSRDRERDTQRLVLGGVDLTAPDKLADSLFQTGEVAAEFTMQQLQAGFGLTRTVTMFLLLRCMDSKVTHIDLKWVGDQGK